MRAAALHKLHRATDRHAAELIAITPMASGGYLPATPSDASCDVMAHVTETSTSIRTSGNSANSGHNVELLGATHSARFETSGVPFRVDVGYEVVRLRAPGLPKYRVAAVYQLGTDRTILLLTKN